MKDIGGKYLISHRLRNNLGSEKPYPLITIEGSLKMNSWKLLQKPPIHALVR